MSQITSQFLQLLLGSLRLRALGAGLLCGALAHALAERTDGGLLAPALSAAVMLAGVISVVQISLDNAPRRDAASLRQVAERAVVCVGLGILIAMHLPRWF